MSGTAFKTTIVIAIAGAFIIGTLTANPVAEAINPVLREVRDTLNAHLLDPSAHHSATSTSYYTVFGPAGSSATSGMTSMADADCNPGDKVVAGGFGIFSGNIKDFRMFSSNALDIDTWRVFAWHDGVTGTPGTPMMAQAVARCLDLTP